MKTFLDTVREIGYQPATDDEMRLFESLSSAPAYVPLPEDFRPPPVYLDLKFLE